MFKEGLFLLQTIMLINIASSYKTLKFGKCSVFYVTEEKSYTVKWDGDHVFSVCMLTFHGYDSDNIYDKFKVCVRATTWEIYNDDVKLRYYSDKYIFKDTLVQTYNKSSLNKPTTSWCSESDSYVELKLITAPLTYNISSSNQGHITLEITAVQTYNYIKTVATWVGAVLGSLVVIAIICIVLRTYFRKTKGRTLHVTGYSNASTIEGNAYRLSGGFNSSFSTAPPPYTYFQKTYPDISPKQSGSG